MTTFPVPPSVRAAGEERASTSSILQIAAAALLGVFILLGVGFAPLSIAHNAVHDTRHALAFPCH